MTRIEYRIYAAYGNCPTRTGHAMKDLKKVEGKARTLSMSHPFVEVRTLTSTGKELLINTYVGGRPLVTL